MFSPVDHRVPRINVLLADCPEDFTTRPGDYTNTLFICRITNWAADSNFAEGWVLDSNLDAGKHFNIVSADLILSLRFLQSTP